jgi:hypothetical protein
MNLIRKQHLLAGAAAVGLALTSAHAQKPPPGAPPAPAQPFVYPAKGQSPEQQKKDEGECHVWAAEQSKYDPTKPPPQAAPAKPPTTASGTTPGAGVRGAARGAVVGEIVGDDAGAAAGAVAARGQSRKQNAAQAKQQQQAATQQQEIGMANYQRARAACLEGRGYTVK